MAGTQERAGVRHLNVTLILLTPRAISFWFSCPPLRGGESHLCRALDYHDDSDYNKFEQNQPRAYSPINDRCDEALHFLAN